MPSRKTTFSSQNSTWRQQIVISFALMALIPLLTLGYIIISTLSPEIIRKEVILLLVSLNILLSVTGFYILKKNITLLAHFREYIENISKGNLGYKFRMENGPEITSMTKSFEVIVGRLQNDRERLRATSNNLESEVEQRTQALRESNMKLSDALADLKAIQGQIIQQERLSALGQMASGIAHDFNNLLMPIVGLSEYLLTNNDARNDKEELQATLKDIHSAGNDARKIVQRLREFYKIKEDMELTSTDINAIIENTLSLTQPRWKEEMKAKGAPIEIKKQLSELPGISANPAQLREALTNIVMNALDAMPTGGTLELKTFKGKESVIIEIKDSGTGMTDDVKEHCFEPFFSTKGAHGTGIGLAMTFGIIKRHHGTINVTSKPDAGTRFTISIPLTPSELPDSIETIAPDIKVGSLRVLVIDDDKTTHTILKKYLETENHTVETARTGKKGIQAFSRKEFDLVITDRAMPDMSGDEVSVEIKGMHADTPIIMLTGFGEIMKGNGEIPIGVDTIVGKPATQREINHAIARAIHKTNLKA